ncbi:MAG: hypothetical protein QM687_04560 [Ferruginibacter sp.]
MDTALWENILAFDLDDPQGEYGFSIRLANENYWTKNFTSQAILEYKKFMYLAAASDQMVAPSPVVDTVWHQHLIFTQSYSAFCGLIGKQVQHIPSTHNKEDFQKFRLAKERAKKEYEEVFGKQPGNTWHYGDMYDGLHLEKAKTKLRTVIIWGLLALIVLIAPFYFILKPLYIHIDNPYFIIGFLLLAAICFVLLEIYNRQKLKAIVLLADKDAFIFNLNPDELLFLQTGKTDGAIHMAVNELVKNNSIEVHADDNSLELQNEWAAPSVQQLQVAAQLNEMGRVQYASLFNVLKLKPVFRNAANCMNACKKYFIKSKKFGRLFGTNLVIFLLLLLLCATRLFTGITREKPVVLITVVLIILLACIALYLARLTQLVASYTVPALYKSQIIPGNAADSGKQWDYFLFGQNALAATFAPLLLYSSISAGPGGSSAGSCISSCGSSCGSSCSSCGGCGD